MKESGTTRPVAWRCNVSSPIADAVCSAASTSPGSTSGGLPCVGQARVLVVRPDAGEAIGLQLDLDLQAIGGDAYPCPVAAAGPSAACRAGSGRDGRLRGRSHRPARSWQALCPRSHESGSRSHGRTRCRDRSSGRSDNRTAPSRFAPCRSRPASGAGTAPARACDRSGRLSRKYRSTPRRYCRARWKRTGRYRRSACRCAVRRLAATGC